MTDDIENRSETVTSAQVSLTLLSGKLDSLDDAEMMVDLASAITEVRSSITRVSLEFISEGIEMPEDRANAVVTASINLYERLAAVAEKSDGSVTMPFKCKDDFDKCMEGATEVRDKVLCSLVFAVCLAQGFKIG